LGFVCLISMVDESVFERLFHAAEHTRRAAVILENRLAPPLAVVHVAPIQRHACARTSIAQSHRQSVLRSIPLVFHTSNPLLLECEFNAPLAHESYRSVVPVVNPNHRTHARSASPRGR